MVCAVAGSEFGDAAEVNAMVTGNIAITQGNGGGSTTSISGDVAVIAEASVGGSVSVTQGNGGTDTAQVGSATVTFAIGGNVSVNQGQDEDSIDVEDDGQGSTIGGQLAVTQGNGNADVAVYTGLRRDHRQPVHDAGQRRRHGGHPDADSAAFGFGSRWAATRPSPRG